ncbi:phosphotransferase [Paractinoplanes hotanensis]|uniref:phosphotransferase n=1 Tax=Paractinoplanes hotanensis TaxID=2906497 RepID=UPI0034DADD63
MSRSSFDRPHPGGDRPTGRELGSGAAASLIEQQFPTLAPASLQELGGGWDNVTFLVNRLYVFKFPRSSATARFLMTEGRLLRHIARVVPVEVPRFVARGRPTAGFHFPFLGYRMLPGNPACAIPMTIGARIALARPIGRFLAALHRIPAARARRWGAPDDRMGRLDPSIRIAEAHANLDKLVSVGLVRDNCSLRRVIDSLSGAGRARLALVHGDLYSRHLVLNSRSGLTAVIDWGETHVGDRALDLSLAFSFLPPEARPKLMSSYGQTTSEEIARARFRAVWHTLHNLVCAVQANDDELAAESLVALDFSVS